MGAHGSSGLPPWQCIEADRSSQDRHGPVGPRYRGDGGSPREKARRLGALRALRREVQKNRAVAKRFEALLGEEMRARGVTADLDVNIYFAASSTFLADNPSAMRPLAAQVAGAVVVAQPAVRVGAQTTVTVGPATVRIHRIRNLTEGPFGVVQPFWWADGKEMVRAAVRAKEQKLKAYRGQLGEVASSNATK